jgi:hypothetical protein
MHRTASPHCLTRLHTLLINDTSKPGDRRDSLLAAIQRKAPSAPAIDQPEPEASATVEQPEFRRKEPRPVAEKPKARKGKQVQFWFHEEDGKLVRELSAWLAGQGVRPTDSLVIRAALRTAPTGTGFLQAYRKAAELDGRLKKHKVK